MGSLHHSLTWGLTTLLNNGFKVREGCLAAEFLRSQRSGIRIDVPGTFEFSVSIEKGIATDGATAVLNFRR